MILDCLKTLRAAQKSTTISTIITRVNQHELRFLAEFLKEFNQTRPFIHAWHLYKFLPKGRGGKVHADDLRMSDEELKSQFDKAVASVPRIVGINNHMGSAFTENEPKMILLLKWVKGKGFYFLDSHTSVHSVVSRAAKRVGVPCLVNETFLDNQDDVKSIERQLDLVLGLAKKRGRTIAIGHYRRKYLVQALADKLPEFRAYGVDVVTLPTFYHDHFGN